MKRSSNAPTGIVLASASPRRRDLLSRLSLNFEIVPANIEEDAGVGGRPERVARRLARAKALAVAQVRPDATIIAADTIVADRGRLLGKPRDAAEATAMLASLRAHTHSVVTAIAVAPRGGRRVIVAHCLTQARMRDYTDAEIAASVERGDPFDKAGGYAIQDDYFAPVESYTGCYCNVVGLPLWTVADLFKRVGCGAMCASQRWLPQCASCPQRR